MFNQIINAFNREIMNKLLINIIFKQSNFYTKNKLLISKFTIISKL